MATICPRFCAYFSTIGNGYNAILTVYAAYWRRQAVGYILREEVVDMPITITLHILGYVVTIRIKSENRHSAK